ncbi:MAG: hypothetical protein BWK80_15385, partial [Desulfobacteraceae bacterium IS3]
MKAVISILFLLVFMTAAVSPVFCGEESGSKEKDIDTELEQELRWIRAEAVVLTDIATKTEMDADLAPGIVTILQGSELEERGFHTVWDALTLIPGLDTSMGANGSFQVTVRGIGNAIAAGKI